MTIPEIPGVSRARPIIELSVGKEVSGEQAGQIPRDDVFQYIHEMCVTLAFLAASYENDRLAKLLRLAGAESERCLPARRQKR